jgi:two-component system, NarL family, nitrate/nitrite response regulator NarL
MNVPAATDSIPHAPRVVLLEDHTIMRESLVSTLESAGVPVVGQYSDGRTFLEEVQRLAPDVALVDLVLEHSGASAGMDGLSVLKALRATCPAVRAVVLSGMHTRAIIEEVFRAGAAAFLHKLDASRSQVVATVQAVARGERPPHAEVMPEVALGADGGRTATLDDLRGQLTLRERQVLGHIATGADNLKIAALLDITERTVRAHVSSLYRKLQCENRAELALLARDMGVYAPGP